MMVLLLSSVSASALNIHGGGATLMFEVSISSGTVNEDLTDFSLRILLDDLPSEFWANVETSGRNIRAYQSDGVTRLPMDITRCDPATQRGELFVKTTVTAATDTVVYLGTEAGGAKEADGSTLGRNAVWADYEVVWVFPEDVNRTGKHIQNMSSLEPYTEWYRKGFRGLLGNPHQGVAQYGAGLLISIDTNYLRKMDAAFSVVASNADPILASGIANVSHCSDGTVVGGELFVPINEYPVPTPPREHIAVFDVADLSFKRSYDISASGHHSSSIAYDGTHFYITDFEDGAYIYKYDTSFTLVETITLSQAIFEPQGIEYIEGVFYVTSFDNNKSAFEIELDGTVNGVIYNAPEVGRLEGLTFDGSFLYVMNEDGDLTTLEKDPELTGFRKVHFANISATLPVSTTWTAAASVYWSETTGDLQQGFLSLANGSDFNNRTTLMYDNGPDELAMWNSTDSWIYTGIPMGTNELFHLGFSSDGSTQRRIFADGVTFQDSPVSPRPVSSDTMDFVLNATVTSNEEDGEAYYQNVWLRNESMSDEWMRIDALNRQNPTTLYSVTPPMAPVNVTPPTIIVVN